MNHYWTPRRQTNAFVMGFCLASAYLASAATLFGQAKPGETTPEQLQAARDAYQKAGVEYIYPTALSNPWKVHCFRTKWPFDEALLKDLPRVSFPFALELYGHITDEALKDLKNLGNIQHLLVGSPKLTDKGLAELRILPELRSLDVPGYKVTDAGLKELKAFPQLRFLNVRQSRITDAGLKELQHLTDLRHLDIQVTSITDAGLKELKCFKNLEVLVLNNTRVTDAGMEELKDMKSLRDLSLCFQPVTDAGLKQLQELPNLRTIFIMNTKVTSAGIQAFQKSLPACTVKTSVFPPKKRPVVGTSRPKKPVLPYDDEY